MLHFPRREISEIVEIANREAGICSIFVEGKFDKDLFEKYFRAKGLDQVISVYPIDTIEVSNDLLVRESLNLKSNKARVIGLAIEISKACGDSVARALCIVDADCDRELGLLRSLPALRYTDFTCMEMYGLTEEILSDIFEFSMGLDGPHVVNFLRLMDEVLPTLFALRCCNEELGLSATMPDFSSGFEKKKTEKDQKFSSEKYVMLFIQQNKLGSRNGEISDLFRIRFGKLSNDIRDKAHGHDAVRLFYWYLNRAKVLTLNDTEVERVGNRILLSGVNFNKLDMFELFSKIPPPEVEKK